MWLELQLHNVTLSASEESPPSRKLGILRLPSGYAQRGKNDSVWHFLFHAPVSHKPCHSERLKGAKSLLLLWLGDSSLSAVVQNDNVKAWPLLHAVTLAFGKSGWKDILFSQPHSWGVVM